MAQVEQDLNDVDAATPTTELELTDANNTQTNVGAEETHETEIELDVEIIDMASTDPVDFSTFSAADDSSSNI